MAAWGTIPPPGEMKIVREPVFASIIDEMPKESDWECYLFGTQHSPYCNGLVYRPIEGHVPNFFIRWMMKICFNCTWRKVK